MTERLNNHYSGSRVKTRFDWVDRAGILNVKGYIYAVMSRNLIAECDLQERE